MLSLGSRIRREERAFLKEGGKERDGWDFASVLGGICGFHATDRKWEAEGSRCRPLTPLLRPEGLWILSDMSSREIREAPRAASQNYSLGGMTMGRVTGTSSDPLPSGNNSITVFFFFLVVELEADIVFILDFNPSCIWSEFEFWAKGISNIKFCLSVIFDTCT